MSITSNWTQKELDEHRKPHPQELKNQLGMPQEQSEEEVEEEVDTSTVFMSRYYLRVQLPGGAGR